MPDIQKMITSMTLEEKANLCTGGTAWTTTPVERLDVPELFVSDGPHGVRRVPDVESISLDALPATCFPTASCTASSWDRDLLQELGRAVAKEAIALGVDVVLGPGANIKRTPVCGRNFEYISEDPYLAGELAASFIEGAQSQGVGTSLKHYAANNQEYHRMTISAEVDERTLREIYLPAFETAVKRAKPWTVMCCHNRVNGIFGSEHERLLTEILKDEWGFEGLVVSDWGAVHDRVAALKAGLDLEMPGPRERRTQAVIEAVQNGDLEEEILDEAVRRILRIVFKASEAPQNGTFDAAAHHALARKLAGEGMVLLKNDGILPLKDVESIAVIGRAAKEAHFQGGGSSHIHPTQVDIPLDELKKLAGNAEITYSEGYPDDERSRPDLIGEAVAAAREAEVALLYVALPTYKESEGYDRTDLDLTPQQEALIRAVTAVQPRSVVILNNGSAVTMGPWIDGAAAVLEAWMMGQAGGGAIADVLFGNVNPSGKLAETFPLQLRDTPAYINYPGEAGKVHYGEGIFVGYRYYDVRDQPVLFPFGHGLSYTTFEYSPPRVSETSFDDVGGLTVSVDVTNTGPVAGKEIVQFYVHDRESALSRPPKELKDFAKVALEPGETQTVSVHLDFRAFAYYHPSYKRWITEDGDFDILIGASAADIRCVKTVTMSSTVELPSLLDRESTIREWLEDPRGQAVLAARLQELLGPMLDAFGESYESEDGGVEVSEHGFVMDMPLRDVLGFQANALPMSVEEIVNGLLSEVHGSNA